MSTSRLVMTIDTNLPVNTLKNILTDNSTRPLEKASKVLNFFHGLKAGARQAVVKSGAVDSEGSVAAQATATATLSGAMTPTDTVTINGITLTGVASAPTNNQFIVGVNATADAAALTIAINTSTTDALSGVVHATSALGVVTISCLIPGVIGNSILISKSSTAVTLSGSSLTSGFGKLPVLTTFHFSQ